MTFSFSHKTVIVLDRRPFFMEPSNHVVDFDLFMKSRIPVSIPLPPVVKSLWTCNVEAVLEYVRVVYDLFPASKLIQLIACDSDAYQLNDWTPEKQNLHHMMGTLSALPPSSVNDSKCNLMHGLNAAVEALCRPSPLQQQSRMSDDSCSVSNRGRIICLSTFKSDGSIRAIQESVYNSILEHNKLAATTDNLLNIDECELALIDVTPIGKLSSVAQQRNKLQLSNVLSSEVHTSQSGRHIAAKLLELVVHQFALSSTTVTGIPMKEEQNASSSANYDVELFHSVDAHLDLIRAGKAPDVLTSPSKEGHSEGLLVPSKEGLYTDTVTLKWCTPKSTTVELQQCTGAFRITPVDVNSRPSSCLTNFLLTGRSVMLEQPRKAGTRLVSHMLTSHGGEIYIHTLSTWRSILEDPPSISEGTGGRITDYRISDFGEFMKENRLAPVVDPSHVVPFAGLPINRAKSRLERMTRHWPMVISDTIIFNMPSVLDPLPSLITKDKLDEAEFQECRKVIFKVLTMESRGDLLPVPASGVRGKGSKREEMYRQMWAEFERFVRAHATSSPMHQKVLECLIECKKLPSEAGGATPVAKTDTVDPFDSAMKLERKDVKVEVKNESNECVPTAAKKYKWSFDSPSQSEPMSLFTMWTNRINMMHRDRCREFAGRLEAGPDNKTELYQHLKEQQNAPDSNDAKNGVGIKK